MLDKGPQALLPGTGDLPIVGHCFSVQPQTHISPPAHHRVLGTQPALCWWEAKCFLQVPASWPRPTQTWWQTAGTEAALLPALGMGWNHSGWAMVSCRPFNYQLTESSCLSFTWATFSYFSPLQYDVSKKFIVMTTNGFGVGMRKWYFKTPFRTIFLDLKPADNLKCQLKQR